MSKVRFKLWGCVLLAAILGAGLASWAAGSVVPNQPTYVQVATFDFMPNGGFTPTLLSKTEQTPIALLVAGKVKMRDGSHPPALTRLAVQLDKNIKIDLNGYPTCRHLGQQVDPPMTPQEECRGASIGKGTAQFEIQIAEEEPIRLRSRLQIFNAGPKNGIPTLVAIANIGVPVPGFFVASIQIKKIHDGRFATEAIFTLPKIAGGNGSITSLDVRIRRRLRLEGAWFAPVTARCRDGKLSFHFDASFLNYRTNELSNVSDEAPHTCSGR